jgi:hypothetical protein
MMVERVLVCSSIGDGVTRRAPMGEIDGWGEGTVELIAG